MDLVVANPRGVSSPVAAGERTVSEVRRVASPWLHGQAAGRASSPVSERARNVTARARKRMGASSVAMERQLASASRTGGSPQSASPRRTRSDSPRRLASQMSTDAFLAELELRAAHRSSPSELSPSEWVSHILSHASLFAHGQEEHQPEPAPEPALESEPEPEPEPEPPQLTPEPNLVPELKLEPEPEQPDPGSVLAQRLAGMRAAARSPAVERTAWSQDQLTPGAVIDSWLMQMPHGQWNPTDLYEPGALDRLMNSRRGVSLYLPHKSKDSQQQREEVQQEEEAVEPQLPPTRRYDLSSSASTAAVAADPKR